MTLAARVTCLMTGRLLAGRRPTDFKCSYVAIRSFGDFCRLTRQYFVARGRIDIYHIDNSQKRPQYDAVLRWKYVRRQVVIHACIVSYSHCNLMHASDSHTRSMSSLMVHSHCRSRLVSGEVRLFTLNRFFSLRNLDSRSLSCRTTSSRDRTVAGSSLGSGAAFSGSSSR